MKNAIKITKYIKEILDDNTELQSMLLIDNEMHVYPIAAKIGTTLPYIIINRNLNNVVYSKDGPSNDIINVSVLVVAERYSTSIDIAELVRKALEYKKFSNDEITIKVIKLRSVAEDMVNDLFVQQLNFEASI